MFVKTACVRACMHGCACVRNCRLNQLEEASSLAADFQSMRRDLRSSLSAVERKLNALDTASTGSVEVLHNQLQTAKVS